MLTKDTAKRVTIIVNEDTQRHLTPLHDALMSYLLHKGVSGATATRVWSGFGSPQILHTPQKSKSWPSNIIVAPPRPAVLNFRFAVIQELF